jgi:hypothetical protein
MAGDLVSIALVSLYIAPIILRIYEKILPEKAITALLFDGKIRDKHKTKYALTAITDRYKSSISGFNKAVAFNVGFVVIALYGYIVLPPTEKVTIPFVGLSVSRSAWISIVPLISYALQTFIITTFIWFMVLRLGMKLLYEQVGSIEDFGDVTNILLDGSLGQMWIILRIMQYFKSKLNLIWAVPVMILLLTIITSPILICIFFIFQLFSLGSIILGVLYSIFLIPFASLFLLLIATAAILGIGEFSYTFGVQKATLTVKFENGQTVEVDSQNVSEAIKALHKVNKETL